MDAETKVAPVHPVLRSRKYLWSCTCAAGVLIVCAMQAWGHLDVQTSISAIGAMGLAFGLAVHHQGGVDRGK